MNFKNAFLLVALISLFGCAHGSQVPESVDDAQAMTEDETDTGSQLGVLDSDAGTSVGDVQEQASAKVSNAVKDKAGNLAGNAAMSKAIAAELLRRTPLIADSKTLVYANTVGQFIAQELVPSLKCRTDGTPWNEVRVGIIKSPVTTSFSLAGGLIFVTTGLMKRLNSEDEFAGVLANEIAMSLCGKGVPGNLAMQAANGWTDYIVSLPTKPLAKSDLMFADKYALVTLYRRGYDITPYVNFIAKNELAGRHVFGNERAAVLQKSVAATPPITPSSSARMARFNAAKAKSL